MGVSVRTISDGLLVGAGAAALLAPVTDGRDSIVIHNQRYILYVKCGQGASPTDYTYQLTQNCTLELANYDGPITAIASQDSTYVRVTEFI